MKTTRRYELKGEGITKPTTDIVVSGEMIDMSMKKSPFQLEMEEHMGTLRID